MEVKHYFCLDNIIQGNIISAATFVCKAVKYVLLLAVYPAFMLSYIGRVVPLRIAAPKTQRGCGPALQERAGNRHLLCINRFSFSTSVLLRPQITNNTQLPTRQAIQIILDYNSHVRFTHPAHSTSNQRHLYCNDVFPLEAHAIKSSQCAFPSSYNTRCS